MISILTSKTFIFYSVLWIVLIWGALFTWIWQEIWYFAQSVRDTMKYAPIEMRVGMWIIIFWLIYKAAKSF